MAARKMDFHRESIDFLKTYEKVKAEHNPKPVCRKSFGAPIVRMADSIITTYFDLESVKGVKACLKYEILHIEWRNSIWVIPLDRTVLFFGTYPDSETASLLADSLILTILAYRVQLDEKHSGLAHIVFADIVRGFELICYWAYQGVALEPSKNGYIETFDVEYLKKFIVGQESKIPCNAEDRAKAFHAYLQMRIEEKRVGRGEPGISERWRDLLKTEVAELDVICGVFERDVLHYDPDT